jgi:hypothetical protein
MRVGTSFVAIIYLRPGHISAQFVLEIVVASCKSMRVRTFSQKSNATTNLRESSN